MSVQNKIKGSSLIHTMFWLVLFMGSYSFIAHILGFQKGFVASFLTVGIFISLAYINIYFIIPRFFIRKKFKLYILALLGLLSFVTLCNWLLGQFFIKDILLEVRIIGPNENSAIIHRTPRGIRMAISFFASIGILFISTVYKLVFEFIKKERIEANLRIEKHQNELKFLRSQINPHFLFNALNNLHATVYLKPEQTGDAILKLGEMLRYVIYDCSKERVSLEQEINYIKHYIFFQQQKDRGLENISFDVSGYSPSHYIIEPMLLIPFVENSFKHSYTQDLSMIKISFSIHITENTLHFTAVNTIGETIAVSNKNRAVYSGIGIENVKRRLALSYPNQHSLKYYSLDGFYHIELTLHGKNG